MKGKGKKGREGGKETEKERRKEGKKEKEKKFYTWRNSAPMKNIRK